MAIYYDLDEEKKKQNGEESATSDTVLGGQSGVITGGAQVSAGGAGSPQSPKPTSSGSFTNLQSYLQANQGNSAANKIADNVKSANTTARTSLGEASTDFNQQVQAGGVTKDTSLVDQVTKTPVGYTSDQKTKFQQQLNANYGGPDNLTETDKGQQAFKDVTKASQYNQSLKTEPGRFTLLQEMFKRPDYSKGQQTLDQLLIQNDPNAKQTMQGAVDDFGGLDQQYETAKTDAGNAAQARRIEAQEASKYANEALYGVDGKGGAINQRLDSADARVQQRLADQKVQTDQLREALKNRDLTGLSPEQVAQLGIPDGSVYGMDFSDRIQAVDPTQITRETAMTPQEFAELGALHELGGVDNPFAANKDLAGTMDDEALYSFNSHGIQDEINQRQNAYQDEVGKTLVETPYAGGTLRNRDHIQLEKAIEIAKNGSQLAGASPQARERYAQQYAQLVQMLEGIQGKHKINDKFKR